MVTISVIVPHFNRQELIVSTLEALSSQTCADWELIVVDDKSRQDPTAVIKSVVPDARVILQESNRGPAAARNVGIDAAVGRFVAFLDSDDHWEPDKLARQLETVLQHEDPDNIFCVTSTRVIDAAGRERSRPSRPVRSGERFADFLYVSGEFAQSSSFFLAREKARKIRFCEALRQYEDHLFFVEAGNAGMTYVIVDEPLVTWRDDDRADRLGRSDSLDKGLAYLDLAGPALGERACLAFQIRFLGIFLLGAVPRQTMAIALRALRKRAISPRDILLLLVKAVIPLRLYASLKSRLS